MSMLGTSYTQVPGFQPRPWKEISAAYVHFADDDVLLAKITPCFENGKAGVATNLPNGIGAGSSEYFVCRTNQSLVLPRYLFAFFKTDAFLRAGALRMTGSVGHKRVPKDYLLDTRIPLAPLAEQKRIVDKLDTLIARIDACRDRLDGVPALIKRFRQAVLSSAVSGSLTADWRDLHGIERSSWTMERADQVCDKVQSGGTPREGFAAEGVPFLKVYNLVNQRVDFDYRPQFITKAIHDGPMAKSKVVPGDVVMNIVGPPLGKVAIVPTTHPVWNLNQALTLFRPSARVSTDWLYVVLREGSNVRAVMPDTKGSVGQVNISLSQCRAFVFPIPDLNEQSEITRRVGRLMALADALEERVFAAQGIARKLVDSSLAMAFRGELVAQDPTAGPAAQFLERLAADTTTEPRRRRRSAATPA